ncbi:MAG: sodium-dependent transporter [Candidatus Methanoliparum thermophilum]|uniref:Sodium-dependent transporter n=1 Tax=Methanoliparum thermophilum TaxID=2491083 RepID=A0A520KRN2_METT2|nr:sodium-dependent transporter [Candidatus Methanoliparum sp. LAM-1]RZN64449.1 MAG: sodium-dependent transporter [Candidatus Methanoliparum thermophilum]BDC35962.1 sodium-dependent transporter [Candidatus Methanoliparum sp. LAM-1]
MDSERERWTSRSAFIFAAIGSAIGLGNLWRFSAMCYNYGQGTFLILYMIGLIVLGIPWFLTELGMGHVMQRGAPGSFSKIGKKWEWAGWWPVFLSFFLSTYYVMIMSWAVCYMGFSIFLSWETAGTALAEACPQFFNNFLGITGGPFEFGSFNLLAIFGSILTWVAIFFILHKGVRRVSKVVYFTVIVPWLLLAIVTIRGLTLPGAVDGLNLYLTPDLSALGDASIWVAAFGQIAFTLSIGMGVMYAYGSYLPKRSDVTNNALIIAFADSGTAFLAGFAVFSVIGYMLFSLGIIPPAVGGLGLAFQTYPAAVSLMPFGQRLTGFIFFLCLWFLGIDSAFSMTEAITTAITDKWDITKSKATGIVCLAGFLIGLIYTTGAGIYWLDMIDRAVSFIGILLTGVVAMLIVGWVYGADRVREHLNSISTIKLGRWFDWLVKVVAPALCIVAMLPQLIAEITGENVVWGIGVTDSVLAYDITAELIGFWGFLVMPIVLAVIFSLIKSKKEV